MIMVGRITPEKITELSMCEIFVFGSNLKGHHRGGASLMACERFGAEWGVGAGPTGKCYAIPTSHLTIDEIRPYVDNFIKYARSHPDNRFLVTRVGCGSAGYSDEEMAPLFQKALDLYNVAIPKKWMAILTKEVFVSAVAFGIVPEKKRVKIPKAITEEDLKRLCEEYKYIIGARILAAPKPEIHIRYVIDRDRFGYADFGDFFFWRTGDLYVWTRNKEFAETHNQDIVEDYFEDECRGRGYCCPAIFAGVRTPYKDANGDYIYTGDVIEMELKDGGTEYTFALGTFGRNEEGREAYYAFALDNHCIRPEMCRKMTRVGTVFYQLDWCDNPVSIPERCYGFQPWHPDELTKEDRLVMSRYTPNFDQEVWKYHANEVLGIEFNWRK